MPLSLDLAEVRGFLAYLRLRDLAPTTIRHYQRTLDELFRHCPAEFTRLDQITPALVRDHLEAVRARGYQAKTLYERVQTIEQFFAYLVMEGYLRTDPARRLPRPKIGKRLPKALSLAEMEALLHAMRMDTKLRLQDRILIELLYAGGLRIQEALHLRVEDCDLSDGAVRVIGKGDVERRIYLKSPVLARLRKYIEEEKLEGWLFPGRSTNPATAGFIRKLLKQYAQLGGITRRVTPHVLRHSIAVHYLQGGAPINFVQSFLGHAKLSTTGEYLLLSDEMAKRIAIDTETAVDRLNQQTKSGTAKLQEARSTYRMDEFETWDAYVTGVVEWLVPN